jgi:hypothetical protein
LRNELYKIFDKIPIIGDVKEIINFLDDFFKSYNIVFEVMEDRGKNGIVKGRCKRDLKIIIFCTEDFNIYFENKYKFSRFLDQCIFVLSHELVHRGQYIQVYKHLHINKTNNGKDIDINNVDIKHYSNVDEIMAYANLIIEELRFNGYNNEEILKGIKNDEFGIENSEFLELYRINFKNNKKIIDRLYKNIYMYLKHPVKIKLKI